MTDFLPPDPETVELIRAALPNRAPAPECPRCGPKAIEQARRIIEAMDKEHGDVSAPTFGNDNARLQPGVSGDAHP